MPAIHETAYPRFKPYFNAKELEEVFQLTADEIDFLNTKTKLTNPVTRLGFALQLKCYQYLGRPIQVNKIDMAIKHYVAQQLDILSDVSLTSYPYATFTRHKNSVRQHLNINIDNIDRRKLMKTIALEAAETKEDLADIINCVIEELIVHHFELPAFQNLVRLARAARTVKHYGHYRQINQALSDEQKQWIDEMLASSDEVEKSWTWKTIKQEPKGPTPKNMKEYIDHVDRLKKIRQQFQLDINFILPARLEHLRDEAMVLDQSVVRSLEKLKRYALVVILIHMKYASAMDDLVQVLILWIRKIESKAKTRLQDYQVAQAEQSNEFILLLYNLLLTVDKQSSAQEKLEEIEKHLGGKTTEIIEACREHLGLIGDKHFSWMMKPYRDKRSTLLKLIENLSIHSSTEDKSIETALCFIKHYRSSHKEWVDISSNNAIPADLSLLSEAWFKLVTNGKKRGEVITLIHRHYYELAIFYTLMGDLNCGDAYVEEAFLYNDPNKEFISWEDFDKHVDSYCQHANLPRDADHFVINIKDKIRATAKRVDENYIDNTSFVIHEGKPILKKCSAKPTRPDEDKIRKMAMAEMPVMSIIDILVDVEHWLKLSANLKPLSGKESKIANYPPRFIATTFAYGCNLGPTQAERCLLPFTRKQIAWLFHHHATEQRLIKLNAKLINQYMRLELPQHWGPGNSASVDGTFLDMYTQNLLAAHHIRYGRYGGVGYYHVSDQYIALFSNFISSAVHESIYLLDGVVANDSEMKIDKIYGDSWAQSEVLFGLSFLLGVTIMPRIKRFKHLNYYKADANDHYENIQELFTEKPIDSELIRTHYYDMLRVVLSIQKGNVKPSTILRRLCSKSRKNKLYYAFRELGRVIRTDFLLNYIDDSELRRTIQAATCKSEEFNDYIGWVRFGGGGVISDNLRFSQRKMIKFHHLVANMTMFHTVVHQTKVVNQLRQSGVDIPDEVLARFSPHWREHINRFGMFTLNMDKSTEEIDYNLS
jgi:TnpA family transposase